MIVCCGRFEKRHYCVDFRELTWRRDCSGPGSEGAGVAAEDFVAQARVVEVEVDFGGGDAFVAQHLLDGAQVGAAFEQGGGE